MLTLFFFDYPGYSVQDIVLNFFVVAGASPVKIELASAMHYNGYAGDLVTDVTVAANTSIRLTSKTQDLGSSPIPDFIKVSGGVYELKGVGSFGGNDISFINCTPTIHNSINSLKYAPNLVTFGGMGIDYNMLPNSLKCLIVGRNDGDDIIIDDIPTTVQKVSSSRIITINNYPEIIGLTSATKMLTGLRIFDARLRGALTDLPKGIKVLRQPSGQLTGALEDFSSMTGQESSGCIAIKTPDHYLWSQITQGGIVLRELTVPVIDNYAYFTWNNGSYEWASSQPADMAKYITAAEANPQNFVPIVE